MRKNLLVRDDRAFSGRQIRLNKWSNYLAFAMLIAGLLVLAGWEWNIPVLKSPIRTLVPMNPLTALDFVLSALSFLLLSGNAATSNITSPGSVKDPSRKKIGATLLVIVVMLTAVLKIIGMFPGVNFPIDQLFFRQAGILLATGHSQSQMSLFTAMGFLLYGAALLGLNAGTSKNRMLYPLMALIILIMSLFSLLGYLYHAEIFYGASTIIPMAVHTAACFGLLSLSLLYAHPQTGFMREFTSLHTGGMTGRSLLPLVVFLAVILGYLRLIGHWEGLISTELGTTILVTCIILVFCFLIWYNIFLLDKSDKLKKESDLSLFQSQERFRLLINGLKDDAIFMLNPQGMILSWNDAAENIKGYYPDEILGKHISVFYTKEDIENGLPGHNLDRARKEGRFEQEGWRIRKDGSLFWAHIVFTALHDPAGNLVGFAKVTRDFTERKKMEEQLRKFTEDLEEQVRKKTMELTGFFERISDAFIALDKDFRYTYLNRKAGELIHHDPATLIGKCVWDVFPEAVGSKTYQAFTRAMAEQRNISNTDYYPPLDLWQENHLYASPDGLSVFIRDISEQKRSEQTITDYKSAIENSSIVSITDPKGLIIQVNANFCEISGYQPEELIGRTHVLLNSKHHPADHFSSMWRTISAGKIWKGEFCNRTKDGALYWVDSTIIPFLNGKGEPYEYLSIERDITERKKAEALLQQSYEEIRQLASHVEHIREEERAGMAREIHDELGQQLTGLKMDLSWIAKKMSPQEDELVMQKINKTLDLLDDTIRTVRKLSTELRPSILDDLGLVAAIEWQSQEFQKRSGIPTRFDSTIEELNTSSETAIGLFRICQESLTNIARHAEAGHVWITLEEQENEYLLLQIKDDGKGFESAKIGDKKTLGLLGMRERTLMMKGKFIIKTSPGKGTSLYISVPI